MSANYKDTLLLPKTDFPMKADLVKREPERLAKWEAAGLYRQILDARIGAPLFVLHDGPPFANGDVHMGTALNKILKDLVVKSRSMLGFRAPFVPGWDCHGLPIEFKVVKEQRGLEPAEIRRRAEAFARKYIDIQRGQFKRLGVFGSWEDPYLTLAPGYEADIIRAFGRLVEKGLVYQSKKPVYWSTGAQTALAEAEVEYAQRTDPAIWVKFPIATGPWAKKASMVIWTTTPWTLPANLAIAVHPKAPYILAKIEHPIGTSEFVFVAKALLESFVVTLQQAEHGTKVVVLQPNPNDITDYGREWTGEEMIGWEAHHPFLNRTSKIITADFVTLDTGTGQVHIAPGHGKDDYIAGQQNGLSVLSPVDDFGRFVQLDPEYGQLPEAWIGKEVAPMNPKAPDSANAAVIEELTKRALLLAVEWTPHDYPHCWRSKTPIVFRAVEQFFIKVDAIRADALKAIDETQWIPAWGRNRIYGTVESRPDWCISRQRTWGVPLPVFYEENGTPIVRADLAAKVADLVESGGTNLWFEKDDVWWAAQLGLPAGTSRRNDTLDVWIDSGVSHQAVTSRHPELKACGGVADVYLEATDQHRGWFQSSLMTSVALTGHAPYKTVITHGFVVDKDTKKKVSKSDQGTYKKPMEAEHFVGKFGADIVRLWAASVDFTNDVPFSEDSFARTSEAYRSFRNVLRILLANISDFEAGRQEDRKGGGHEPGMSHIPDFMASCLKNGATTVDRWVLSKLQGVIATCRAAYEAYDFRRVFETVNQFCTVELSALYVDITKDRLYCDAANSPRRRATQSVMHACFDAVAKLLAPILAYTADEAWEFSGKKTSVHIEKLPEANSALRDEALEAKVDEWLKLRAAIYQQAIEPARQAKTIAKSLEAAITLEVADAQHAALNADKAELEEFLIISELTLASGAEPVAKVFRSGQPQCPRCWRQQPLTAKGVCTRCDEALPA
ncbi:MAG: isoleucine--tRNA ligase [Verrucomicrobia bacterium]|nr:isoleucine--tRNA ligase [Verrucomicrobiota bacterium]